MAEFTRQGMRLVLLGAERPIRWSLVGARAVEPRAEGGWRHGSTSSWVTRRALLTSAIALKRRRARRP